MVDGKEIQERGKNDKKGEKTMAEGRKQRKKGTRNGRG